MKRLVVTYGDQVLFDGEVAEFSWSDSAGGVKVEGRVRGKSGGGGGLLDLVSGLSKQKTAQVVEQKREDYEVVE